MKWCFKATIAWMNSYNGDSKAYGRVAEKWIGKRKLESMSHANYSSAQERWIMTDVHGL